MLNKFLLAGSFLLVFSILFTAEGKSGIKHKGKWYHCDDAIILVDFQYKKIAGGRKGFIVINPFLAERHGFEFVFWHECAHAKGIKNEYKADCFAAKKVPHLIDKACRLMHPERCRKLRQCVK